MVVNISLDTSSEGPVASTQPRLAFIGLGNMGRGMVRNLATKGKLEHRLTIYNRNKTHATNLARSLSECCRTSNSINVAYSIEEAIESADVIFTCLGDDKAVLQCFSVALRNINVRGKIFAECSAVHPSTGETLLQMVEDKGASLVTSPVFGAADRANSGQLICVLSGPSAALEIVRPFYKGVMGQSEIVFRDAPPSKALTLKVIGNTLIFNMVEAIAEAHVLAEKSGLLKDLEMHSYIEKMFPGPYEAYSARMVSGDYWNRESPLLSTDLARKDAAHARTLARDCGTSLSALEVADAHLAGARELRGEKADYVGIYGLLRHEAGLSYETSACEWIM